MSIRGIVLLCMTISCMECLHVQAQAQEQDVDIFAPGDIYILPYPGDSTITVPKIESPHSIGIEIGLSKIFLTGNYYLNTYSSRYLYDDRNDIFDTDGSYNYKIGLLYNYYLTNKRLFALTGKVSYLTRHGTLTAYPKYLVRDITTLDTAYLATKSVINTKFNAYCLDITFIVNIKLSKDVKLIIGLGPTVNLIEDTKKSDYTSTILGLENPDKFTYRETDITYKNGSKTVTFDNVQETDLGNAIESNRCNYGIHATIGIDWSIYKDVALRIESSPEYNFTNYFKNQPKSSAIPFYLSIGILYSGIF